jgi:uncharacterized small protein (DUF1192 family)
MSQCEQSVTLTTVKRDAKYINELALRVESEEELKHVEKLARQYEIGYLKAYNGATSLEFKRLTNDALREAGYICDEIHAENERIATMQNTFHTALQDLDTAWSHDISSKENDLAEIAKNNERIAEIEAEIEKVKVESDKLYDLIIEKCYPEDLLAEHDVLKEQIVGLEAQIAKINDANRIIRLAYKLHNLELEVPVVEEVVETEATEAETEVTETTETTEE